MILETSFFEIIKDGVFPRSLNFTDRRQKRRTKTIKIDRSIDRSTKQEEEQPTADIDDEMR